MFISVNNFKPDKFSNNASLQILLKINSPSLISVGRNVYVIPAYNVAEQRENEH